MKEAIRDKYRALLEKIREEAIQYFSKQTSKSNERYSFDGITDVYFLESFGLTNSDVYNLGLKIQNLFINFVAETFEMVFTERGFIVIRADTDIYRNMVVRKDDVDRHIRFRCFSNLFTYAKSDKTFFRFFSPTNNDLYDSNPEFVVKFFMAELERWLDGNDDIVITNTPELCFADENTKSLLNEFKNIYSYQEYALKSFLSEKEAKYFINLCSSFNKDVDDIINSCANSVVNFTELHKVADSCKEFSGIRDKMKERIDACKERIMATKKSRWLVSFETGEWLWSRIGKTNYFDNSFIITPYFKSIEQLLRFELSSKNIKVDELTLGQMSAYIENHLSDFQLNGASVGFKTRFIKLLNDFYRDYRNKYIHTSNTTNWNIIRITRLNAIVLICCILYLFE